MSKQVWRPLLLLGALLAAVVVWLSCVRTVQGRVRDAETGQPLAGARVTVGGRQVLTDVEGSFRVPGVRGLVELEVDALGYEPQRNSPLATALVGMRQVVTLSLEPRELRGQVIDVVTGIPLTGATVSVGEAETQTDPQGRFSVKRAIPGSLVTARAPYYRQSDPLPYEGQATLDIALDLLPAVVTVRNLYTGEPIAGATVTAAGLTAQSDAEGQVSFARLAPQTEAVATAKGFAEGRARVEPGVSVIVGLRPSTVRGRVQDQEGRPLAEALVLVRAANQEPRLTYTNQAGEYVLEDVPDGARLLVRRAGYGRVERELGRQVGVDFRLEPFVAKGIYIPFGLLMPGMQRQLQANLDLVARSELNAVVIDVKSDRAWLAFKPALPLAQEIDASYDNISDLREVLAECKRRNIYTIARIVVFKDNVLAKARPQWAVRRASGALWIDDEGLGWTDPFRKEVWDYNVGIAREAAELGFDEIQFDYLRFPSDGDISDTYYLYDSTKESRCKAIADFVAYARRELDKTGAFLSADLFGLVTSVDPEMKLGDLGIGQRLVDVAPWVDYVSPMVYPSTYKPGHLNLRDPWRQPYEVVKIAVQDAQKQTSTLVRPWLQHYSLYGVVYGTREFRLEKQAARDAAAHGWLFWNAGGVYDAQAFDPE